MISCGGCPDGPFTKWLVIGGGVAAAVFAWWGIRREFQRHPDPRRRHWWAWWTQMLLMIGGGVAGIYVGGLGYVAATGIRPDEPFRGQGNIFVFLGAMGLGGLLFAVAGIVISLFIVRRKLTVEETLDLGEYIALQPGYRELAIASREPTRRFLNRLGLGEDHPR